MPKDINLKDLEVGDTVAYAGQNLLRIGTLVDLPEDKKVYEKDHVYVRITYGRGRHMRLLMASRQVALVEKAAQ